MDTSNSKEAAKRKMRDHSKNSKGIRVTMMRKTWEKVKKKRKKVRKRERKL